MRSDGEAAAWDQIIRQRHEIRWQGSGMRSDDEAAATGLRTSSNNIAYIYCKIIYDFLHNIIILSLFYPPPTSGSIIYVYVCVQCICVCMCMYVYVCMYMYVYMCNMYVYVCILCVFLHLDRSKCLEDGSQQWWSVWLKFWFNKCQKYAGEYFLCLNFTISAFNILFILSKNPNAWPIFGSSNIPQL